MKRTRKIAALLTVCAMCYSLFSTTTTFAAETNDISLENNSKIQKLLSNLNEKGDYSVSKILKDSEENERYIYLPFSTGGYLIYDKDLDVVHEYSTISGNEYIEDNSDIYYAGALGYYEKNKNTFLEIPTGKTIGTVADFATMENEVNIKIKENFTSKKANFALSAAKNSISGSVPNYSYNPDGICGSTSAGMLLRWYDIYVNGKYVPSNLESSDGIALIKNLRNYIDGSKPGSSTGDVYSGIMAYCKKQGVSHDGGYAIVDINYIVGRVDTYGTPFVLGLHNHPKYSNHWVTGYGYNISGGSNYVTVNDGWGNRGVSINLINCDYIIW